MSRPRARRPRRMERIRAEPRNSRNTCGTWGYNGHKANKASPNGGSNISSTRTNSARTPTIPEAQKDRWTKPRPQPTQNRQEVRAKGGPPLFTPPKTGMKAGTAATRPRRQKQVWITAHLAHGYPQG